MSAGSGTKAGDPLGDLLFTVAIRKILVHISTALRQEGLTSEVPFDPRAGPLAPGAGVQTRADIEDVSYVDDDMHMRYHQCPLALIDVMRRTIYHVHRVFRSTASP